MTNGEKIKEIFPNITERFTNTDEYTNKPTRVEISVGMHILTTISVDVWNAEYIEPTTKNDLGVDCISRQEVLNIAIASKSNWIDNSILFKRVNELPSITPQDTRWVPVSERLPEANIYDGHGPVWKHEVLITGYLSFDDKKETFVNMAFAEDVRNKCVPNTNVTAWMPLPTAYKEAEE